MRRTLLGLIPAALGLLGCSGVLGDSGLLGGVGVVSDPLETHRDSAGDSDDEGDQYARTCSEGDVCVEYRFVSESDHTSYVQQCQAGGSYEADAWTCSGSNVCHHSTGAIDSWTYTSDDRSEECSASGGDPEGNPYK